MVRSRAATPGRSPGRASWRFVGWAQAIPGKAKQLPAGIAKGTKSRQPRAQSGFLAESHGSNMIEPCRKAASSSIRNWVKKGWGVLAIRIRTQALYAPGIVTVRPSVWSRGCLVPNAQHLPRIALRSTLPSVAPKRIDLRARSMAAVAICTASSFLPA